MFFITKLVHGTRLKPLLLYYQNFHMKAVGRQDLHPRTALLTVRAQK